MQFAIQEGSRRFIFSLRHRHARLRTLTHADKVLGRRGNIRRPSTRSRRHGPPHRHRYRLHRRHHPRRRHQDQNERTGAIRETTANSQGAFAAPSLAPSSYTVTAMAPGMAQTELTAIPLTVGQERNLLSSSPPPRCSSPSPSLRRTGGHRHQFGPRRRQRQRARSRHAAAERPATLAALPAGSRGADRRRRQLRQHPLQRPRQPAERHPLRRRRSLLHHRRFARQPERRNLHRLPPAVEPRKRAGVPRGVQQLPGRVRHRHRRPDHHRHQVRLQRLSTARCSNTCATTRWTRATSSTPRNPRCG